MSILWSLSTTIRNPERIPGFFITIAELDGETWNHETQKRLQAILIMKRLYKPEEKNLTTDQIELLDNVNIYMTYQQARKIFDDKKYQDPPMRGRTSFDPVEKMGLVHIIDGKIRVSELGKKFLNEEIDFGEVIFRSFTKLQYPNPLMTGVSDYNTKPFINTLRIIKLVNEICVRKNLKVKGISREEFGIFVLSLKDYRECQNVAERIIDFRLKKEIISDDELRKVFVKKYILKYLESFQDPIKNTMEYSDNMIRCLRLTKFIYIRGNGYYIDLEPRRMIEINSLLSTDDGSAKFYSKEDWISYMGKFDSYRLPWEMLSRLGEIRQGLVSEVTDLQLKLDVKETINRAETDNIEDLKLEIEKLRLYRTSLQTRLLKVEFSDIEKIDQTISDLINIRDSNRKPSVELERLSNIALNILNDAITIKPNYPVGDDNQPTFTAPSRVADIECFYKGFNAICEVTMLTSRDQWFNEGQPVMRHLREFESKFGEKDAYCLFIAPKIHDDTLNTFWISVKHEYQGKKQRIIPITITQLIDLLKVAKLCISGKKRLSHSQIKKLMDDCLAIDDIPNSIDWKKQIATNLKKWTSEITS